MKAGKPVLGILAGSGKEIIEEGNIGFCAIPDNIEDIAQQFRQMISYAQVNSDRVKVNAQKLMEERFNKQRIVQLITDTITPS